MKHGPDIAFVASLMGDPARANMLLALMGGGALTVSELAEEAGVTLGTASSHIAKLQDAGLVTLRKDGRNRFVALSGASVGEFIERLQGLAGELGHMRQRRASNAPALKCARVCYDHLAGEEGVWMYQRLRDRKALAGRDDGLRLTRNGEAFVVELGIDLAALRKARRRLCLSCRDWSEQRDHLGGALGAALLDRFYEMKWAAREKGTRIVRFTPAGERRFRATFG